MLWKGQLVHLVLLLILLALVGFLLRGADLSQGHFLGLSTGRWLFWGLAIPILHQVYVWLVWRTELLWGYPSQVLGERAFTLYMVPFFLFLILRPLVLLGVAIADRGSLDLSWFFTVPTMLVILFLSGYTMRSVVLYFGFRRAAGIDHFDPSYRDKPVVKEGMFKYSQNAMYTYGLLILWFFGFLFQSRVAIVLALFQHAYIWVHYLCTEKPDMKKIYGT